MKFTINGKELKGMIDKCVTAIDKKSIPELTKIWFTVEDGMLELMGTDLEHFAQVTSEKIYNNLIPGTIGIDISDIKILTKLSGELTITYENESKFASVKCGNKTVNVPVSVEVVHMAECDDMELMASFDESWLLETLVNLDVFTDYNNNKKVMQSFNFNLKENRIEALDGYRIGIRNLESQNVVSCDSVMLLNKCVPVLKKILSKKSHEKIELYQGKKYVEISGKNFTYIIRRVDGVYYDISKMITNDYEYKFNVKSGNMLSVMKYDCDLRYADDKKPVFFCLTSDKLYAYQNTGKYEMLDSIEVEFVETKSDFYIGFNPYYFVDVFSIVDTDKVECYGLNSKAPLNIIGNEYRFVVLPVNISQSVEIEKMQTMMEKDKVA